ncbi:MAG TPA: SMC-Scp complex subunit ScpB [Patescibacteria group bacterium]|nr:SMC-Scp complex subunit ScpB [Patescibacteria group bacterium]
MSTSHPIAILESLLFISGEPLSFKRLSKILSISEDAARQHLKILSEKYTQDTKCGLQLILNNTDVILTTKPEYASFVESLIKNSLQENLSKAALEVLAIIAYRAPITRVEIESIRGVNCSFTLRNLLLRDLIERQGNPEDARGYIYTPTFRFLESLGLKNIEELPEYSVLSKDARLNIIAEEGAQEKHKNSSSTLHTT